MYKLFLKIGSLPGGPGFKVENMLISADATEVPAGMMMLTEGELDAILEGLQRLVQDKDGFEKIKAELNRQITEAAQAEKDAKAKADAKAAKAAPLRRMMDGGSAFMNGLLEGAQKEPTDETTGSEAETKGADEESDKIKAPDMTFAIMVKNHLYVLIPLVMLFITFGLLFVTPAFQRGSFMEALMGLGALASGSAIVFVVYLLAIGKSLNQYFLEYDEKN